MVFSPSLAALVMHLKGGCGGGEAVGRGLEAPRAAVSFSSSPAEGAVATHYFTPQALSLHFTRRQVFSTVFAAVSRRADGNLVRKSPSGWSVTF